MILLQDKQYSTPSKCHYLEDETWRFNYFFATGLDEQELGSFLEKGWRKFGYYYFRPECPNCRKCIPIRVCVNDFRPSRSQKRIIRKNSTLEVRFNELNYSDRIFEIYEDHSRNRFGKESSEQIDFISSFYSESCPTFQSEYYLGDKLIGVGYIDRTYNAFSSIYYIYDTRYSNLGLGTFSILKEIEHSAELGLDYYYLGYYIEECESMAYKGRFFPYETYNWETDKWSISGCLNKE